MKIPVPLNFNENLRNFLRRNGYASIISSRDQRLSFVKRLTTSDYPRFHIYIEKDANGTTFFNLHLDQIKFSQGEGSAHLGEYDSELVDNEANQIKKSIYNSTSFKEDENKENKKNFWNKLFG